MSNVYEKPENKLEILRIGFDNQVQYLRMMSEVDLKIFSGYITIQLLVASWLAKYTLASITLKAGIIIIDLAFAVLAIIAFHVNQKRRKEAVSVLTNLCEALGFTVQGVFLPGKAIQTSLPMRPWTNWYYTAVVLAAIGVDFVVLGLKTIS